MKRIDLFNPEHDLALANGDRHFIAPANIRAMAHDLALLMQEVRGLGDGRPFPWGWDSTVVERFKKMGVPSALLPSATSVGALRQRSERGTAHLLLDAFKQNHTDNIYIGESRMIRSVEDIAFYAEQHGHVLLKAPLSGSGKGLRHVNLTASDSEESSQASSLKKVESWANALIHRHGYLTAEPYYTKVQDFAMEFMVDAAGCHFIGYSLFVTDHHGRYTGSRLMSDEKIEDILAGYVSRQALHEVRDWLIAHKSAIVPDEWDTDRHPIYFGVDMMIIKTTDKVVIEREQRLLAGSAERSNFNEVNRQQTTDVNGERLKLKGNQPDGNSEFRIQNSEFKLHPCVEINLRMNMGIIAHEIYRHRLAPEAEGMYHIARFVDNATLRAFHEEQSMEHPSTYCDGRLVSGYAAITPIADDTQHIAYIIVGGEGTKN